MRMFSRNREIYSGGGFGRGCLVVALFLCCGASVENSFAQSAEQQNLSEKVQKLSDSLASTQSQLERSQRELEEMRNELKALQQQLAQRGASAPVNTSTEAGATKSAEELAAAVQEIRERQALQESQIATHEQTKIESDSKFPVKITGMLLMNAFVNTGGVDMPATPTVALVGSGSAGATVRQTVLGLDARGPHMLGARSFADLRVDFASSASYNPTAAGYFEYSNANSTYLRLRTVHAGLEWSKTQAFFSLDRPILNPETPTSLTAVAEPALAWSGNLWVWNPQAVISQNIGAVGARNLELQAGLIDPGDAPLTPAYISQAALPPNSAEQSSRPGVEARIALLGGVRGEDRSHIGVGGYFARHQTALGRSFDSWATTMDARLLMPAGLQLTGGAYRGLGLGGLGGGAYKDFVYKANTTTGGYFFKALDDVGGWGQLKEKVNERLEINGAFGIDNVFSGQMRRYFVSGGTMYQNLTINRTFTGNVIFSPSAYLLFSLEYRHLGSSPIGGSPAQSNIIGLGAGYKF
jgi:TolA-binding protein